jgi:hypothetical protein|nr:MAG TPA: hypothetical protein [Bacteriophage sp.]
MKYAKIPDGSTYKSWVQLEAEAMRIITALDNFKHSLVIVDGEPPANNVLYFDTTDFS